MIQQFTPRFTLKRIAKQGFKYICTLTFIAAFTRAKDESNPNVFQMINGYTRCGIYIQWNSFHS